MTVRLITGDCRERLAELEAGSVDSCVCDPPYHLTNRTPDVKWCADCGRVLGGRDGKPSACPKCGGRLEYQRSQGRRGFMGQEWDGGDVAFQKATWEAVYRVLKPGAHLIAFSGTRTYHRMACAIEDAGFEIRDQLAWIYGSGFPKSHDVAKGLDKLAGEKGAFGEAKSAAHQGWIDRGRMRGGEGHEGYQRPWMDDAEAVANNARQYIPATEAAQQFQGWGTALKPAWEPICLARKPLEGTVAANVLKHGTGAINIDGCRIETNEDLNCGCHSPNAKPRAMAPGGAARNVTAGEYIQPPGRWPANIIHDGSEEVLAGFPETESGSRKAGEYGVLGGDIYSRARPGPMPELNGDSGSAARFFYCAKATSEERGSYCRICRHASMPGSECACIDPGTGKPDKISHPTQKPEDLMRWLVRLVTPKGGTVLDPFAGSGSTLIAADREQFNAIGIELSEDYAAIARRRLSNDAGMFAEIAA